MRWPRLFSKPRDFGSLERSQLRRVLLIHAERSGWQLTGIYIGGSQAANSPKRPRPDSDIDVYVFFENLSSGYAHGGILGEMLKGLLGFNFDVHMAGSAFESIVTSEMEVLYRCGERQEWWVGETRHG